MLEVLTQDHMEFISNLEPDVFVYILSSISEGLTGIGQLAFAFLTFSILQNLCSVKNNLAHVRVALIFMLQKLCIMLYNCGLV